VSVAQTLVIILHILILQIPKGSSVYACAVAKKLLEAVEIKKQALNIFN
jgi:hypothetical protein